MFPLFFDVFLFFAFRHSPSREFRKRAWVAPLLAKNSFKINEICYSFQFLFLVRVQFRSRVKQCQLQKVQCVFYGFVFEERKEVEKFFVSGKSKYFEKIWPGKFCEMENFIAKSWNLHIFANPFSLWNFWSLSFQSYFYMKIKPHFNAKLSSIHFFLRSTRVWLNAYWSSVSLSLFLCKTQNFEFIVSWLWSHDVNMHWTSRIDS